MVNRIYEGEVDLPAADATSPPIQHFTSDRVRDALNLGPHFLSMSGHGSQGGCCGMDDSMAHNATNGFLQPVTYACRTNILCRADVLCRHLVSCGASVSCGVLVSCGAAVLCGPRLDPCRSAIACGLAIGGCRAGIGTGCPNIDPVPFDDLVDIFAECRVSDIRELADKRNTAGQEGVREPQSGEPQGAGADAREDRRRMRNAAENGPAGSRSPALFSFITLREERFGALAFNPYLPAEIELDEGEARGARLCDGEHSLAAMGAILRESVGSGPRESEPTLRATLAKLDRICALQYLDRPHAGAARPSGRAIVRGYAAATSTAWFSAPKSVIWDVTYACNLSCPHCLTDSGAARPYRSMPMPLCSSGSASSPTGWRCQTASLAGSSSEVL